TGASFSADFGQIHALVGENGAGKSTMIKILSGVLRPDTGDIRVRGTELALRGPRDAQQLGIATVFQELTLMPWMTVAENLLLHDAPRGRFGLIQRRALGRRAARILDEFGITRVDPNELAGNMSVAERQVVEIVRALRQRPDILFLDEPTAALGEHEVEWLFAHVRELRDAGCCVIFTSHRWREIEDLADRVTVFRNGTDVASRDAFTEDEAVTLMTGRSIDRIYPNPPASYAKGVPPALEARNLRGSGLHEVSLSLQPGEIVGVGGLAGQGQRQLFLALFGAHRLAAGSVLVSGKPVSLRNPSDAIRHGIALIPEDRKNEGLLLPLSVRDNLSLANLRAIAPFGVVQHRAERQMVGAMIDRLAIRTSEPSQRAAGTLSGGNQQKVLLGRWLLTRANVLLLYDVTRGVDAATKHDLYALIVELAQSGKAVLMFSSETEEVAHLSHRVLVMREGRISTELAGDFDAESIVAAAVKEHV
ncbi:MAG: sugar ABC transporter ATP-binding protein, partial [Mycobacteriales bacterium]